MERTFGVRNPATGDLIVNVPDSGAPDARLAADAAYEAFARWKEEPAARRAKILKDWHDLVMANREDMARLLSTEQGKPLAESREKSPTRQAT